MLSDKPLVSIIMPVHNCEKYIGESIDSLINQTYKNWELLIGDDASSDSTRNVLKAYTDERIKVHLYDSNRGAVLVRNELIQVSKGSFITFQDADDISHSSRLEFQLNELLSHPDVGMVGCQLCYINAVGTELRTSKKPIKYADVKNSILVDNVFCGATVMMTRKALNAVGGAYREYFNKLSYEDYDLTLRIEEKYPCYNLPNVLYYYRQHSNSTSKGMDMNRLLGKHLAVYLARQRRARGFDDLQDKRYEELDSFLTQLKMPYQIDRSLVYRAYASDFMYNKMFRRALLASVNAIQAAPLRLSNYRTLSYCMRVAFREVLCVV